MFLRPNISLYIRNRRARSLSRSMRWRPNFGSSRWRWWIGCRGWRGTGGCWGCSTTEGNTSRLLWCVSSPPSHISITHLLLSLSFPTPILCVYQVDLSSQQLATFVHSLLHWPHRKRANTHSFPLPHAQEELEKIAQFIDGRGRVSVTELTQAVNRMVHVSKNETINKDTTTPTTTAAATGPSSAMAEPVPVT